MDPAPWADLIPEDDRKVFQAAGFGQRIGLGRRPVLLVIDVQYRTVGSEPRPILDAIREYPTSCGEVGWRAVAPIASLVEVFRRRGGPVIYPCVARKDHHAEGGFAAKAPGVLSIPDEGYEFVAEIAPRPGELVLPKAHASAFFGTALASHLVRLGVDSIVSQAARPAAACAPPSSTPVRSITVCSFPRTLSTTAASCRMR